MNPAELQAQLLQAFLAEYGGHVAAVRRFLHNSSVIAPGPGEAADALFSLHTLKGAARAVGLTAVEQIVHALEDRFQELDARKSRWSRDVLNLFGRALDSLEDVVESRRQNLPAPDVRGIFEELGLTAVAPELQQVEVTEETVRLPVSRLTALARDVGAILSQASEIDHLWRSEHDEGDWRWRLELAFHSLRRYAREAHSSLREALTQPASDLLGGLGRVVRELATAEDKEVRFLTDWQDIHVERSLLQSLLEPAMHLLRNAVHHGVQTPAERQEHGWGPQGTIWLRVRSLPGRMTLEVEDDGPGLDHEALRTKSRELGLSPTLEPVKLLTRAGLSTSREIGTVAGRGMGLGAVQAQVDKLSGTLELVDPERGGMRWRITVPTTLLGQPVLLLQAAGVVLGLPSHLVSGLLKVSRSSLVATPGGGLGVTTGERVVPLATLSTLLGRPSPEAHGAVSIAMLANLGLVVDSWVGFENALVLDLDPLARTPDYLAGAFFREDGSACGVLSATWLEARSPEAGTQVDAADTPTRPPVLLVVDDSLTTRTMALVLLQSRGYETVSAADGLQALEVLRERAVDLVLSDVQMPNLDGLGLLGEIRANPRWSSVPVILLTSLNDAESVRRGLEGGADAYLVKQEFDQQLLLDTIEWLL